MAGRRRSWFLAVVALIVAGLACPAVISRAAAAPVSAVRGGARAEAASAWSWDATTHALTRDRRGAVGAPGADGQLPVSSW